MAQGDIPMYVVGNLVADPELRYTQTGVAVANGRIASTPRRFDSKTNQWVNGDATFLSFNVWRGMAEVVANQMKKGDRVMVFGTLHQRSFDTREGEKRTVFEIEVDDMGPSLKFAGEQKNFGPNQWDMSSGVSNNDEWNAEGDAAPF